RCIMIEPGVYGLARQVEALASPFRISANFLATNTTQATRQVLQITRSGHSARTIQEHSGSVMTMDSTSGTNSGNLFATTSTTLMIRTACGTSSRWLKESRIFFGWALRVADW